MMDSWDLKACRRPPQTRATVLPPPGLGAAGSGSAAAAGLFTAGSGSAAVAGCSAAGSGSAAGASSEFAAGCSAAGSGICRRCVLGICRGSGSAAA